MTWRSHLVFGLLLTTVVFATNGLPLSWIALLCALFGSLAPDLDANDAKIRHVRIPWGHRKKDAIELTPLAAVSSLIHTLFGHRGVMHSLVPLIIIFAAGVAAQLLLAIPFIYTLAFLLGYMSHLITDAMTPSGILLFYPSQQKWHAIPRPWHIPLKSMREIIFFGVVSLLLVGFFYANPYLVGQVLTLDTAQTTTQPLRFGE
jgi:inner membrane protein